MAPPPYRWRLELTLTTEAAVEAHLGSQKRYLVAKSQLQPCTVCVEQSKDHKMRMKRVYCSSSKCGETCEWNLRARTCRKTLTSPIDLHSHHITEGRSPPTAKLNLTTKRFVRECTKRKLKPKQTVNEVVDKFDLKELHPKVLPTVQSFVHNFRRTHLGRNEIIDVMAAMKDWSNKNRLSSRLSTVQTGIPFSVSVPRKTHSWLGSAPRP